MGLGLKGSIQSTIRIHVIPVRGPLKITTWAPLKHSVNVYTDCYESSRILEHRA